MTKIREVWENKYKRINVKNNKSVTFLNPDYNFDKDLSVREDTK